MPTVPPRDGSVVLAPHVVVLGAGASIAAYNDWGKTGPRLPSMNDLLDVLSVREEFIESGYDPDRVDFESLYDELVSSKKNEDLRKLIERRVIDYFSSLSLPDSPTIYDYLVLALREKDLIATFNWDPFLAKAFERNRKVTSRKTQLAFLHGNVDIAICKTDGVTDFVGRCCSKCGKKLTPSKLLYPVGQKDYSADPFIKNEWDRLRDALGRAYYLTIFGYSAPKTDVEARKLMLDDWKANPTLVLAQVDVIDISPEDELEKTWEDFFVRDHYMSVADIFRSYLFQHPRRSCDAFAAATLMNKPWYDNPFPRFKKLAELQSWIGPLIEEEDRYAQDGTSFTGDPILPNKKEA